MLARASRPPFRTVLAVVVACAIGAFVGYLANAFGFWIPPFGWLMVGYAIGIVCHELGHVLFAAIGSIPVRRIQIGVGPILLRRRFGDISIELRLFPLSGVVVPYPVMNFRRLHWALFLLGGALTNAAVIAAIAGFNRIGTVPDQAGDFFDSVVFAQVIIIVATIFPYRYAVGGTPVASDGLQILQLLWQHRDPRAEVEPKAAYADLLSGYSRGEDSPPAMSRASARILYQVYRADRWTDKEARRDFQKSLLREVEHEQLSHEEQMLVLDALVTDGLISGDRALRSRLDEWSLQALAHGPQLSSLLCTRGAVLIELGHYEEGKALLTSLATAGQLKPFDSFMNQIFLARAEHALGNIETARELAKAARTAAEADPGAPPVVALLARLPPET